MKKAYYAHCVAIYGSKQEARDIATIEALGFECVNPNTPEVAAAYQDYKQRNPHDPMQYFSRFSNECDVVIFRALPEGTIPAGIEKEIGWFIAFDKPVLELPSGMTRRRLTLEQTREYLKEVGQR